MQIFSRGPPVSPAAPAPSHLPGQNFSRQPSRAFSRASNKVAIRPSDQAMGLPANRLRPCCEGRIDAILPHLLVARLPYGSIGDVCQIRRLDGSELLAEIISAEQTTYHLAPIERPGGIQPGSAVKNSCQEMQITVPATVCGKILDCRGRILLSDQSQSERRQEPAAAERLPVRLHMIDLPLHNHAPQALERLPISTPFPTGIRAIDALCTFGVGQRIGLFAPPGLGKSTLVGMLARHSSADMTVIGLIGERSREVLDFVQGSLGWTGLRRSVLVVATSDESPLRRWYAALGATSIAEYYRSRGCHVLFLLDSLTRIARALREIGLADGEPAIRQGYTPSVFAHLPQLIERCGASRQGTISAVYTILTQADSFDDALAEEVKSLVDGHLCLDPALAQEGVHPALDLLNSVSRLMPRLLPEATYHAALSIRRMVARLRKDGDLLLFGGTPDPELQAALHCLPELKAFMRQGPNEFSEFGLTCQKLLGLAQMFEQRHKGAPTLL